MAALIEKGLLSELAQQKEALFLLQRPTLAKRTLKISQLDAYGFYPRF